MRIFAVALFLGLTACSATQVIQTGSPSVRIDSLYNYGASGRDLKLTVQGGAYGLPADVFARMVEADLQVTLPRPPTHPTLTPGSSARPNFGLVFAFQPSPSLSGQDLCDGHAQPGQALQDERVRVVAAFCVAGAAKTQVDGAVAASGPDDPAFRQLMAQMMLTLFRPDEFEGHRGPRVVP
jgi:hypothetical protein